MSIPDDSERSARDSLEEGLRYYSVNSSECILHRPQEPERERRLPRILKANVSLACLGALALATLRGKQNRMALPGLAAGMLLTTALFWRSPSRSTSRRRGLRWRLTNDGVETERLECARFVRVAYDKKPRTGSPTGSRDGARAPPLRQEQDSRTSPAPRRKTRPWYRKARYWVPLLVVIVLVVLRLLLTPVVERFLRSGLQKMEGFSASFSGISLSLKDLKLIAHDFAMDRIPAADAQQPLLDVKTIEVDLLGKELLRGRMVAQARFIEPRLYLAMAAAKSDTGASPAPPPAPPDMTSGMKSAMPFRFDRIEIRKGEMTLVDTGEDGSPEIRLGEIEATIENIETGTQLGTKRPSVFAARAKLQNSGEITLFYTANLLSRALTFAGQARLKGLKLAEINPLIASKTGMKVEKGEFDVFTAFSASDGIISGGVKPFLKHVDFKPWKEDMVTRLKVGLTDLTFWVFSDRVPSREAVAGIVPFHGEITNPSAQILPTILSVVRNAFVLGLASGFAHLPPDKAALEGSLGAGKIGDKKD